MTIIEKERKWLLKQVPYHIFTNGKEVEIMQYYTDDGWRYRSTYDNETGENTYIKLKKVKTGNGINQEVDIQEIEALEFLKGMDNPSISKTRHTLKVGKYTVEVDEFDSLNLCIMEIEDVDADEELDLPDWLTKEILMEVTGMEAFDNSNLAT